MAFAYSYTSSFTVYMPSKLSLVTQEAPTVTLTSLEFGYNFTSNKYDNVTVTLLNQGSANANVTVHISLYGLNETIAAGTSSFSIPTNIATPTTLTITLNWAGNYTVANMTNGEITLHQQPTGGS
jgi:hypothetical protein